MSEKIPEKKNRATEYSHPFCQIPKEVVKDFVKNLKTHCVLYDWKTYEYKVFKGSEAAISYLRSLKRHEAIVQQGWEKMKQEKIDHVLIEITDKKSKEHYEVGFMSSDYFSREMCLENVVKMTEGRITEPSSTHASPIDEVEEEIEQTKPVSATSASDETENTEKKVKKKPATFCLMSLEELKKIAMEEERSQTSEHSTEVEQVTKKAKLVSSTATPDEASALVTTPSPSTCTKIGSPSAAQQSHEICSNEKAKVLNFSFGDGPVELDNAVCPQIASSQCAFENCNALASYGYQIGKPVLCVYHKGVGMTMAVTNISFCKPTTANPTIINALPLKSNTAPNCSKQVHTSVCSREGCDTRASFGYAGAAVTFCFAHKLEGMNNLVLKSKRSAPEVPKFGITPYQNERMKICLQTFNAAHPQIAIRCEGVDKKPRCGMRMHAEACYARMTGKYSGKRDRGIVKCGTCGVFLHETCFPLWHAAVLGVPKLDFALFPLPHT